MSSMFDKIKFFKENFKEYYLDMKNTEHTHSEFESNPYHAEGSIFTHSMMVCSHAKGCNDIIQYSTLLHDIGKPGTILWDVEKNRTSFRNHGSFGIFLAYNVLNHEKLPDNLSNKDKIMILKIIANHQDLYTKDKIVLDSTEKEYYNYLKKVSDFDTKGAIQNNLQEKEAKIEFIKKEINHNNPELVIMIGPPCSGKSTIVDFLYNTHEIISRDFEMLKIANEHSRKTLKYNDAWKYCEIMNLQKEVDIVIQKKFNAAIKSRKNIVIDMTNMSKKSRKKWLSIKNYNKKAHVKITGYDNLLERNANRNKYIDPKIIDKFLKSFTWPTYEEFDIIEIDIKNRINF